MRTGRSGEIKISMTKTDAVEKLVDLIIKYLCVGPDRARYLADRIYSDVIAPAVEDERNDFIRLAKFPDNFN